MQNSSSIEIHPQRCGEYWLLYLQLLGKNQELVEARKGMQTARAGKVLYEMDVIKGEISRHFGCCERCQAWLRSFDPSC